MMKYKKNAILYTETKKIAKKGDIFSLDDNKVVENIVKLNLGYVVETFYAKHGYKTPNSFIRVWNNFHRKKFDILTIVYMHILSR